MDDFRGTQRMWVERAMHGCPTENDAHEAGQAALIRTRPAGLTLQLIDRNGNLAPRTIDGQV